MSNFPTLRIGLLHGMLDLRKAYNADDKLFESQACPYDPETVEILKAIMDKVIIEKIIEKRAPIAAGAVKRGPKTKDLSAEDQAEVENELSGLLKELKKMGEDKVGGALDTATRLQIIKSKTTLIEQLVKMRERVLNVKEMATFREVVVGILDDLMEEDARQEFLKRIEPYRTNA